MGRKERKQGGEFHGHNNYSDNQSGRRHGATGKDRNFATDKSVYESEASFVRNQADPETTKYFSEIANVIEGTEIDLEERTVVCGNALEEARGKEVELATDYIISHTMETLLNGCSLDHLCAFLRNSAGSFSHIATDRSGSRVLETAIKSLSLHLQDSEAHSLIEETITALCQTVVVNPADIMCNTYGSHVLRRLMCLCKGVPPDSSEYHGTKSSVVLAERLNLKSSKNQSVGHEFHEYPPFPDQLKLLISEMLNPSRVDIAKLQINEQCSLVLQTALKLLAGDERELFNIIPILLGSRTESGMEGNMIEVSSVKRFGRLVEDPAYSRLMEVILSVAPDSLYDEILRKVFKNSLLKMSLHKNANFVIQELISHARSQEQIKLIWEELGTKFADLLDMGMFVVVAVLLAASQRLHIHEHECCEALADAMGSTNESPTSIIPRILYIDNYLYSGDEANWKLPNCARVHLVGSLMLQIIFKFPSVHIQAYITSIVSLDDDLVLKLSKDSTAARVIEAFLNSSASAKQKRKIVIKLRGHFGELSLHPSGSFTVDKFFDVSNLSMREEIVTELLPIQTELSKTKQGPYLLKKLDVGGFARQPDQWKSKQNSKESAYKDFYEAFGPKESKSSRSENFLSDSYQKSNQENPDVRIDNRPKSQPEKLKGMMKDIETQISSGLFTKSGTPFLAHQGSKKSKKSDESSKKSRKKRKMNN